MTRRRPDSIRSEAPLEEGPSIDRTLDRPCNSNRTQVFPRCRLDLFEYLSRIRTGTLRNKQIRHIIVPPLPFWVGVIQANAHWVGRLRFLTIFPQGKRNSIRGSRMDSSEKWYSRKEVAARWRVSSDTITREIEDGRLQAMLIRQKSGRRNRRYRTVRISESECQRYERTHRFGAGR